MTKDGLTITVKIWDTAGHERFHTMTQTFYKKADGIIITYDITAANTFDNVTTWLSSINENTQDNVPRILVGNKCDLEDQRLVNKKQAQEFAQQNNINFYETSAKTAVGLNDCMEDIFEQAYAYKKTK